MTDRRRFLLVTLDAAGNWPPERALVRELARRGHEVRVLSGALHENDIAEAGGEYRPYRFAASRARARRRSAWRQGTR